MNDIGAERERAKLWAAADLPGLKMLRATYIQHSFPKHFHDTYVICVHERGAEEFYCQGATRVSAVGSVVTLDPGVVHNGHPYRHEPWVCRAFYPELSFLNDIAEQLAGRPQNPPHFRDPIAFNPGLARSLGRLHRILETSSETLHRQTAVTEGLGQLIAQHASGSGSTRPAGTETRAVRIVRDYIEDNFVENPSLQELSDLVGLNPFYVIRAFRKEMGLAPHEFLTQVRVARAMKLLTQRLPIVQVALETGFVDQSHFTKRFKRIVGVTPKQFAQGSISYKTGSLTL